ncbi:hypothetical protein O7621_02215 [Solwaraspora sp. WMMD937]|uniref:hypothetical protein n=1 Tax=Solwaraspora sp. WMMD937 TaxID=3016090 RepID=UPI00249B93C4|nr:hypothetical protein [Solwaraspora sp. WMMD937]WFE22208.1 hypothetical protein O7621_02215 [Solwaraspora sp. WMMD937]
MISFALSATPPADEPPVLLTAAVWSVAVMAALLVSSLMAYLLRRRLEQTNAMLQRLGEHEYVRSVQQPVAAVLVGAMSGYGINIATQSAGWPGYLGWLLGMPLPVVMVAWVTIRNVRQRKFDEQWPPAEVSVDDPVQVRRALRQVIERGADEEQADSVELHRALAHLLDRVVPVLRTLRDRSPQRWMRDHRKTAVALLCWAVPTLTAVAVAAFPHLRDGRRGAWTVLAAAALVIVFIVLGLLTLSYRYSRYRYALLADEVERSAGAVRRRMAERRFGISTTDDGPRRRRILTDTAS